MPFGPFRLRRVRFSSGMALKYPLAVRGFDREEREAFKISPIIKDYPHCRLLADDNDALLRPTRRRRYRL